MTNITSDEDIDNVTLTSFFDTDNNIELMRQCPEKTAIETSWDPLNLSVANKSDTTDRTPPFVTIMISDFDAESSSKNENSTKTELVVSGDLKCDLSLSFSRASNLESVSNDNLENSFRSKRYREEQPDEDLRPSKKKSTGSSASSTTDLSESRNDLTGLKGQISSASEISFKSVNSDDASFKVRKRKMMCGSKSLLKDAFRQAKRDSNLKKPESFRYNGSANIEVECGIDACTLSEVDWILLTGGSPRYEKNRKTKAKSWKFVELCAWMVMKGSQSISNLYSDHRKEQVRCRCKNENAEEMKIRLEELVENNQYRFVNTIEEQMKKMVALVAKVEDLESKLRCRCKNENTEEIKIMKIRLEEVQNNQYRLEEQNKKLMAKVEDLESKLSAQEHLRVTSAPVAAYTPPPPPPPPPPPMPPMSKLPVRSHTLPRCGSAPPRIVGPRLSITPQDIANVKLRNTKDNPIRKKLPVKDDKQPLVTQQILQTTRAKLGRTRPVASSTPKQQLSELEKCLLQDTSTVSSFCKRRIARGTFRSTEELRMRPYPASRNAHSPGSRSVGNRAPRSPASRALRSPANKYPGSPRPQRQYSGPSLNLPT